MNTFSLDAAVLKICGHDSGMKDPRGWVLRQIKRGRFQAYKIGRHYRMSQQQIDAAMEALSSGTRTPALEPKPHGLSLTRTSARQLKGVS
jgi:excisionase family DNA binding protein